MKYATATLILLMLTITTQSQDSLTDLDLAGQLLNDDKIDSALSIVRPLTSHSDPEISAKALRLSGEAYIRKNEFGVADSSLSIAIELNRTIYSRKEEALCLYSLGRMNAFGEEFDKAIVYAERASHLFRELGDLEWEYRSNNILSWSYFASEINAYRIIEHEARQFDLVNQINIDRATALIYNNVGYDFTVMGALKLDSAIALMKIANDLYARLENSEGRWYTLMNLTWQHRLIDDLEASGRYAEMTVAQALKENDRHAVVEAYFQLSETLIELGQISKADSIYEIGLKWRGDAEDRDSYAFDVYYGKFLWLKGKKIEAIERLEEAVKFLTTSEVFYEMLGRARLATYYWEEEQYSRAEEHLNLIENPRNNYISVETRCIAAIIRAKIMEREGQPALAGALLTNWLERVQLLGAKQLEELISQTLEALD